MNFQTSSFGVARVVTSKYNDGNLAVLLNDEFGSPLAKLSVNLPDFSVMADGKKVSKDALVTVSAELN